MVLIMAQGCGLLSVTSLFVTDVSGICIALQSYCSQESNDDKKYRRRSGLQHPILPNCTLHQCNFAHTLTTAQLFVWRKKVLTLLITEALFYSWETVASLHKRFQPFRLNERNIRCVLISQRHQNQRNTPKSKVCCSEHSQPP